MSKKYYYAKDVTCPCCDGLGFVPDNDGGANGSIYPQFSIETIEDKIETCPEDELEYWEQQKEWYYEYYHCKCCNGKGYVHDEVDPITGFTIIELNGECE